MDNVTMLWSEVAVPAIHIFLVNLALSGDNILVIAMAASRLPEIQRKRAIIWGISAAIILRIILTALATILTQIPGLMMVGGVILYMIACRLLRPDKNSTQNLQSYATNEMSFLRAIQMICIADLVMSLDNVLAVAGASAGNLTMMMVGMVISTIFVLFFSRWIASLMDRFRFMIYLGAAILAYTAAGMILSSNELELLWNNAILMMQNTLANETIASLMTYGYRIFTHVFSMIAVAACLVWGILKNRQTVIQQELTIPEPELDL